MRLKIFSMFLFMLFFIGCATNPVTGMHELRLVNEKKEISVGNEQYKPGQQLQGGEYILDKNLSKYIDRVGKKLAAVSETLTVMPEII
jgi:predicted Zn-dependent protease